MSAPRTVALVMGLAAAAVIASVLARLTLNAYGSGPLRVLGYTDIQQILVTWPFLELFWPYLRFPFDYHPLLGWTTGLLSVLGGQMVAVVLLWTVILAAAAAAVAGLLARLTSAGRALAFWSLSPQLLLFGGHNFDVLPVLGIVGATAAVAAGRVGWAGAALGVGTAAKLFPVAALPPLLIVLFRRSPRAALTAAAGAAGVLLAVDGPAILAPFSLLGTGHNPYRFGGNLDTVWTPIRVLLDLMLAAAAQDVLVRVASGLGLVLSYAWWVLRPAVRAADPVPLFCRAIVLILIWSQLYSPQYSIWLLPVFALAVPRAGLLALLTLGDVLTWSTILLLASGVSGDGPVAGMLAGVLIRHAALVLLFRQLLRLPVRSGHGPGLRAPSATGSGAG